MRAYVRTYLAVIVEVGLKHVLNDGGVGGVELPAEGREQAVVLVMASQLRVVVVQPLEVEKLVEDGAHHRRISLAPLLAAADAAQQGGSGKQQKPECCSCCNREKTCGGEVLHGEEKRREAKRRYRERIKSRASRSSIICNKLARLT